MERFRTTLAVLAVAIACFQAQPQTGAPVHNHTPAPVIDGAVHPEQIPDLTAYRLWLVMVARPTNPTEDQKKRQALQIAKIGLQNEDQKTLVAVLTDFHSQYEMLIQQYNAQATADLTRGEQPDIRSMLLQRDQIVQSTHDRLRSALTPSGWVQLDAHVQNEKKRMKIHIEEER